VSLRAGGEDALAGNVKPCMTVDCGKMESFIVLGEKGDEDERRRQGGEEKH
jgi:hypothetical protein